MTGRRLRRAAVGVYVALALVYSAVTPIGEAPDETWHYAYLRLIQDEGRLPGARDEHWQGHQAPLYYLIAAAWASAVEAALGCRIDPARLPAPAPPDARAPGDENTLRHPASERIGAWGCRELAFHLLRLVSIAMTAAAVALAFRLLERVLPGAPGTVALAGGLVALAPSHVFASAMLNNDALANLLAVAGTYLAVAAWQRGTLAGAAAAWAAAAAAATAKLSGAYLFGLVALVVLRRRPAAELRRPGAWRPVAAAAVLTLAPAAVLARNAVEWGDPFAVAALERCRALLIAAGANPPTWSAARYYLEELPGLLLWRLPVAYAAENRVGGPWLEHAQWYVPLVLAGLALSALPAGRGAWRPVARGPMLLLLAGLALFLASFLYPSYRYRWLQARYFSSQLPALAVLAAVGLTALARLLPAGRGPRATWALAGLHTGWLVLLNALVLATGIIPGLYRHVGGGG